MRKHAQAKTTIEKNFKTYENNKKNEAKAKTIIEQKL